MKKKAIIIGAGPAGLTAAYELLKRSKDYSVTILEESNSIGGISRTVNYKGNRMDIGGHRFFSKEKRVNEFWQNIMPIQGKPSFDDKILKREKNLSAGGPDPEKEDNVFLVRNRVSRIYYLKKFFDYPVSMKFQTFKNLGLVRTIQSGFSYLKSIFIKKKEDNLENFYINRFGKKLYSTFFEGYTEKLWGRHPKNISADWGAQRVKGLSILAVLKDSFLKLFKKNNKNKETSLIEEYIYPKYGPGELWEKVAQEIEKMGGTILKNYQVIKISTEKDKIKTVTCLVDNKEKVIKGDIFISSMPLKDLVCNMDKVPKKVYNIANDLPYRDFVTVGLLVKKLNLKNETNIKTLNNIVPDCWIYVQEPDVKLGRIQIFNNWSPYMVEKPKDTVWIGLEYFCNENDDFWNMSEEECKNFAIDELVKMGIIDCNDVLDSHRERVKKAYPAYFDSYSEIDNVINYINKYDNLYCVGRNGQHRYNNMDHSMLTGMKTVDCILNNETNKDEIWNVNTEKEFHEEKDEDGKKSVLNKAKDFFSKIKISKWVILLLMLAVPLIYFSTCKLTIDNDTYFLLNHGKYILEHGFPTIEPFTMHKDLPFVIQQWLFAVGYYLVFIKLGTAWVLAGLILFNYLLMYALYKLCMLVSEKNYVLSGVMVILIDLLLLTHNFIKTRPQIITYLLLILEVYIIERFKKNNKPGILFLIPLISLLLINIHAAMWWFIFIFMLPFIAEGLIEKIILKKDTYEFRWLFVIIALAFMVGFINPYGLKAITYFINSYSGEMAEIITEMRPVVVTDFAGIFIIGILFLYFIIYMNAKEKKLSYLFMVFGCTFLSFMARKSFPLFSMFALYPLCYYFKDFFDNNCVKNHGIIPKRLSSKLFVVMIVIILLGFSFSFGKKIVKNNNEYYNGGYYITDGVDKLLSNYDVNEMKVYCNYDIGGYLEWRGIKPFIDPRAEIFYLIMTGGRDIFGDYFAMQSGRGDIYDFIEAYDFTHLFVIYYDRLYNEREIDNYELFYEKDDLYKIYVRKDLVKDNIG